MPKQGRSAQPATTPQVEPEATIDEKVQSNFTERPKPKGPRPDVLYDDGHGTRAVQWHNDGRNGPYETVQLERPIPKKDGEGFDKEIFHLNERHFDGVIDAIQRARETAQKRQEESAQQR